MKSKSEENWLAQSMLNALAFPILRPSVSLIKRLTAPLFCVADRHEYVARLHPMIVLADESP